MSYAPIYSKINDLETRLTIVETYSKQMVITPSVVPMNSNDLFKVVSGFATKAELPDVSDLYAKFEYMLNVVSQLNIQLTEANEKISALETSRI